MRTYGSMLRCGQVVDTSGTPGLVWASHWFRRLGRAATKEGGPEYFVAA